ncbi:MAG TPA: alkaline phosphatase family protein, partial [Candidatus Eisenbacteria bacterium]|nr:alkaline phosphatase family protein [Candidatus Eisenbacteria bacterium]
LRFRNVEDLLAGEAVYQDITHDSPGPRGMGLPKREPEDAGKILASLAARHAFTLFEFFQTDKAGHMQDRPKAERELLKLERFLSALLANLELETCTLIVTSDHGNVENLSTKSHTHNPVPTLVFGEGAQGLAGGFGRLEDFTPVLLDALGVPADPTP